MIKVYLIVLIYFLFAFSISSVDAKSVLISDYDHTLNVYNNSSSGNATTYMTTALDIATEYSVAVTSNFENLSQMLNYDALWLEVRYNHNAGQYKDFGGSLSPLEISNIRTFINTGRRVVMIGEWGYEKSYIGWGEWDNQILNIVGGTFGGSYGDYPNTINPISVTNHELTENVSELYLIGNSYGTAIGGVSLFNPSFATLWGTNDNVLTILDSGVFRDNYWNIYVSHQQFSSNIANWIASGPVVPEPISSTLFIVGGAALGFRSFWQKRRRN